MSYEIEKMKWVDKHVKELEHTLPGVISRYEYEVRSMDNPLGYEIIVNPNTNVANKKAIISQMGDITLYSPTVTEKQVLMAWKQRLNDYVSSLKSMRDKRESNSKHKSDAIKHLTDNGMPEKEAKELVDFNMELFNRTQKQYGLSFKSCYLLDTDGIIRDIAGMKPKMHISHGLREANKSLNKFSNNAQVSLSDIRKTSGYILKMTGYDKKFQTSDEVLKDVVRYLKDNLLADKYNASTCNTNPAQVAGTIANIVEYVDKKHSISAN